MNIPRLGPLHPDSSIPEWLQSEPIAIPLFDGLELSFILDSFEPQDEAAVAQVVEAFLTLSAKDRALVSPHIFAYYREIAATCGEALDFKIASTEQVWPHLKPTEIHLSRRSRDGLIYVQICAECAWEPEHGLQIVYRRGHALSYVSPQNGHLTYTDAYNRPETEDRIYGDHAPTPQPPPPPAVTRKPWWKLW